MLKILNGRYLNAMHTEEEVFILRKVEEDGGDHTKLFPKARRQIKIYLHVHAFDDDISCESLNTCILFNL